MSQHPKPHRFDKFALRMAAGMLEAIRVTLSVFTHDSTRHWPQVKLLEYLKSAEEMAREMLREIAGEIFIHPAPGHARRAEGSIAAAATKTHTQYFRLCVENATDREDESDLICHPGREAIRDPALQRSNPETLGPGSQLRFARDDNMESVFQRRISALEDVLAHPGRHGARMARALFRTENCEDTCLTLRSKDELMLDHMNFVLEDPAYAHSEAGAFMQRLLFDSS